MMKKSYSLEEATRLTGLPEDRLKLLIQLGKLPSAGGKLLPGPILKKQKERKMEEDRLRRKQRR